MNLDQVREQLDIIARIHGSVELEVGSRASNNVWASFDYIRPKLGPTAKLLPEHQAIYDVAKDYGILFHVERPLFKVIYLYLPRTGPHFGKLDDPSKPCYERFVSTCHEIRDKIAASGTHVTFGIDSEIYHIIGEGESASLHFAKTPDSQTAALTIWGLGRVSLTEQEKQ